VPKREPLGGSVPFWAKRGKDNLSGFRPRDPSRSFLVSIIPVRNKVIGQFISQKPLSFRGVFFFLLFFVRFVHFELTGRG